MAALATPRLLKPLVFEKKVHLSEMYLLLEKRSSLAILRHFHTINASIASLPYFGHRPARPSFRKIWDIRVEFGEVFMESRECQQKLWSKKYIDSGKENKTSYESKKVRYMYPLIADRDAVHLVFEGYLKARCSLEHQQMASNIAHRRFVDQVVYTVFRMG